MSWQSKILALPLTVLVVLWVAGVTTAAIKHHRPAKKIAPILSPKEATAALFGIVKENRPDLLDADLQCRPNINAHDPKVFDETPLIEATAEDEYTIMKKLIKAGADLNAKDHAGLTALQMTRSDAAKRILLAAGAKAPGYWGMLHVYDDTLDTPLMVWNTNLQALEPQGDTGVSGYIDNTSEKPMAYVEVDIDFFDASGDQIDSGMDNTTNLASGGTWKFSAPTFKDGVTSYKIVKVTGDQ